MRKKITILLFVLFIIQFLFHIFQYKDNYFQKFDPTYWRDRYLKSQWVVPNSKNSIGDDGLYAHAGWEYIQGSDPSLLNAEIPPLGKYLIGLSEVIFQNQNIFALLSGIVVLICFYLLNKIIFKDKFISLIPVFLLSADPLFYSQLKAPYLDNLYLGFLILTFYFILREKFLSATVFLGLMISVKATLPTFFLVTITVIIYLFYKKDKNLIPKFIYCLPVSILILLLTYARYFLLGHNFRDFLALQKWILNFYQTGAQGSSNAVWQILLTGNWSTWWGTTEKVGEWSILWPIALVASLFYAYRVFPRRRQFKSTLFAFWLAVYLIFLSIIPVWPRYLLLILPFLYSLTIWVLTKLPLLNYKLKSI